MFQPFYLIVLILEMAIAAVAGAGESGQDISSGSPAVSSSAAAASSGGRQGADSPAGSTNAAAGAQRTGPTAPNNSVTSPMAGALESGIEEGARTGPAQAPHTVQAQAALPAAATAPDLELQAQIQNALNREPALSRSSVTVTESGIELSGSVATSRDKVTAGRLAMSYAGSRKLANRITVTGRATNPPPAAHSSDNGAPANRSQRRGGVNQAVSPQSSPGSAPPLP